MKNYTAIRAACLLAATGALAATLCSGAVEARAETTQNVVQAGVPEVGQPAPDFSLPDQDGKMHHLADYRGRTVILAFYPKDFTGG
jgi:cytochrome oxidase Cu insertion factor (SCO1/SenC/PrrC family)